jgi:hypothetical protein
LELADVKITLLWTVTGADRAKMDYATTKGLQLMKEQGFSGREMAADRAKLD